MKRINVTQMFTLNAYWLGISFLWNSLHPIVLPAMLLNYVPEDRKNTYLGLLTFIGLILAIIVQPISGAVSDRYQSRWGKRRPFILIGTIFDFLFLSILAWMGGLLWIVIGYVGLQISSNIAHGPLQGLLPDKVPDEQLGAASGIKNLMEMLGLVVASLLAGRLLDPEAKYPSLIIVVIMCGLLITALITVFTTKEYQENENSDLKEKRKTSIVEPFKIDFQANRSFWWLIISRFTFLIGVYGVQTFIQYYLRDVLKVQNPVQQTGDLLAVITISLIIFSLAGGWLSDRFGERVILIAAGILEAIGCALIPFAKTQEMLIVFGSILGVGIGLFLTANWALASRLCPKGQAGKFLGLTNLATAGAGAFARLEGPVIDLLNSMQPGLFLGYRGLFFFSSIGAIVSILLLPKVMKNLIYEDNSS